MTVADLVFQEEFVQLHAIAENKGWQLRRTELPGFVLVLSASDGSNFVLKADCDGYPAIPPAWNWTNMETKALNQPCDTPCGSGGYFHESGRICAPWNRIAYAQIDSKGPHSDWVLGNWRENPYTKACTTLAAMALRIYVELSSERYQGRKQ